MSPLSHLIPTLACCECHFHAVFLNFITSRLSTALGTAFQTASGLFCRASCQSSLLFFPPWLQSPWLQWWWQRWLPWTGWVSSWVLIGWHRQAAVGKTAVWSSRASSWPWTNVQLGCNPAKCPVCPGLRCLFLGGKWYVGVLLLGYITSFPELTHGFCLFCLHRVGTASCQQLIFHLKKSGNIGSPGRRGRDIRQVLACISWQHGLQSGQFMWDWQTEAVSAWPHSHRSLQNQLLSSFEKLPFFCLVAFTFNQIGNCSL